MKRLSSRSKGANWTAVLWGGGFAVAALVASAATGQQVTIAQDSVGSLESVQQHLTAGEFSAARQIAQALPGIEGDQARAAIARRLSSTGQTTAAVGDWAAIESSAISRSTAASMLGRESYGAQYADSYDGYLTSGNTPAAPGSVGGAGGGALADFTQLMGLIQTTIAPDQWEALGGPSTMAPYPAGIYVDPEGLVRDIEIEQGDRLNSMASLANSRLSTGDANGQQDDDWTLPAELRIVSIKRLRQQYLRWASSGQPVPLVMQNLAGLSEIKYVIVEDDDILLAGPVGGIDPAAAPWPRDRVSKKTAFGLDLLIVSASAVLNNKPYGCTIDPTPEGLQAATQVSAKISNREIPPALAAGALSDAVGPQRIFLFDVSADHPLAWLLVEADRHMKQLALGQHPMPPGVQNYLDVVDMATRLADRNGMPGGQPGVPNGQLLRMWFAVQPKSIRQASDSRTFELTGHPIRLITAKEFSDQQGGRVRAGEDPLGQQFARGFNQHFDSIAAMYPAYDRLRGAFELTAALQLVKTQVDGTTLERLLGELAIPELMFNEHVSIPTQCESLAVRHTIRTTHQRHEVYVVSGGIRIDPAQSLVSKITSYPVLDSLQIESSDAPVHNTRWWWDR